MLGVPERFKGVLGCWDLDAWLAIIGGEGLVSSSYHSSDRSHHLSPLSRAFCLSSAAVASLLGETRPCPRFLVASLLSLLLSFLLCCRCRCFVAALVCPTSRLTIPSSSSSVFRHSGGRLPSCIPSIFPSRASAPKPKDACPLYKRRQVGIGWIRRSTFLVRSLFFLPSSPPRALSGSHRWERWPELVTLPSG